MVQNREKIQLIGQSINGDITIAQVDHYINKTSHFGDQTRVNHLINRLKQHWDHETDTPDPLWYEYMIAYIKEVNTKEQ